MTEFRSLADLRADTAYMQGFNANIDNAQASANRMLANADDTVEPQTPAEQEIQKRVKETGRLWMAKFQRFAGDKFYSINYNDYTPWLSITNLTPQITATVGPFDKHPTLYGFKLHLSVPRNELEQAAEIWLPILVQHRIKTAQMFIDPAPDRADEYQRQQATKKLVIHLGHERPDLDVQQLVTDLEMGLRHRGVRPSTPVPGSLRIPGSEYIFYRYEKDSSGEYQPAQKYDHGNIPRGMNNPLAEIRVKPSARALKIARQRKRDRHK